MKTKTIRLSVFLAAIVVLCVAGTKISRLTQTTTVQGDSLFLVVTGSVSDGTLQTRSIEATNLISALTNLPNWPLGGSSGSATNVDVRTNANQFGAAAQTLTLKDGVKTTNHVLYGFTMQTNESNGAFTIATDNGLYGDRAGTYQLGNYNGPFLDFITSTMTISPSGTPHSSLGSSAEAFDQVHATNYTAKKTIRLSGITSDRALGVNGSGDATNSTATMTELGYLSGVTGPIQTQLSNQVRVASGTGGITVTPSGSGGIMTYTISDDDAGGGTTTNFTTLASGSLTVGTIIASNLVRAGQIDVLTNANLNTVQVTNTLTVGTTNVVTALAGKQAASMVLSNIAGLASTVFTNVPLGGTNISVRTAGGTNFIDTTGQLNNWSAFPTNTMNSNALNAVLSFGSNQVRVAAGSGITVTPAGSGNVMTYTVASSVSAGGTNYPPVIHAGTNITVGVGVRQFRTISTNASFGVNFQGTPLNGENVRVGVSNYSTSIIYMTNFQSGSVANVYQPRIGGSSSVFTIGPTSISTFDFVFQTNYTLGTVRQELQWDSGYEYRLVSGGTTTLGTNAGTVFVDVKTNQTLTSATIGTLTNTTLKTDTVNISGGVTQDKGFTSSLGIVDVASISIDTGGTISGERANFGRVDVRTNLNAATVTVTNSLTAPLLTAGQVDIRTNLYAATALVTNSINVPIVTNVVAQKWNVWTNYVQTVSNFVFSFNTNRVELKNQTNVVFTNIVEEATAVGADMAVHIHNTTGVTMGLVWPSYGAQHGYFFHTNANNPILSTTALTTGKHGVASFTAYGTNIFATWTEWP